MRETNGKPCTVKISGVLYSAYLRGEKYLKSDLHRYVELDHSKKQIRVRSSRFATYPKPKLDGKWAVYKGHFNCPCCGESNHVYNKRPIDEILCSNCSGRAALWKWFGQSDHGQIECTPTPDLVSITGPSGENNA